VRDPKNVELALIGSALLAPHILDDILVPKEAFAYPAHREVWQAILAAHEAGEAVDPLIIQEQLDGTAAEAVKAILAEQSFSSAHYKRYAEEVIQLWQYRRLHRVAVDVIDQVNAGQKPPGEIVEYGIRELEAIVDQIGGDDEELVTSDIAVDPVVDLIERGGDVGLSTGFHPIDEYFTLSKGAFVILAARPGMGKTALADQIAENVALGGHAVLFVSMEMPRHELLIRRIARHAQIPITDLRHGRIKTDDQKLAIEQAKEELKRLSNLYIYDNSSATMAQILAAARKIKRRRGSLGLIVVDYIQQMIEGGVEGNTVQEMTAIARAAKVMARKLDTTVLALSQLSRGVEMRKDKRPQLADLRESGGLEQAADVVAFIFRPAYYKEDPEPEEMNLAEVIVRKNRQGPLGSAMLRFDSPFAKFYV